MNPQLDNKYAVLYVTRDCAGSQRAVSIAQSLPEIFIQDVGLLTPNQVPTWLQKSPTCVVLSTRAIYTGSVVLQLLSDLFDAKQVAMKEQFANAKAKQIPQQASQQSSQLMQQQYTAQMEGRLYPPQQRSAVTQGVLQQQQGMFQQQQRSPPATQMQMQHQQSMAPMQSQYQPQPKQNVDVVRGSLQPASGTGNYGCSLDAAFAPPEDIQEQPTDSRLTKPGKIDQNDIESYMRMREKTGAGQPNVLQQ